MRRRVDGQTLVEVALILPWLLLAVVVFAQVWCLCHNACAMQMGVFQYVRERLLSEVEVMRELRGQVTPPSFHVEHRMIQTWRPFPGSATVKTPGFLASVQGSVMQWKGGWGLPPLRIVAFAEIPQEPPIPEEQ